MNKAQRKRAEKQYAQDLKEQERVEQAQRATAKALQKNPNASPIPPSDPTLAANVSRYYVNYDLRGKRR